MRKTTSAWWLLPLTIGIAAAGPVEKECPAKGGADSAALVAAANDFTRGLPQAQREKLQKSFTRENAIHWSNLPVGVVPRDGLRLGDLDARNNAAARAMLTAALTACGLTLLDQIRLADDFLIPLDKRSIGWDGRNYYLSILGTPGDQPWMLQLGGHHLAYNLTFNGKLPGATPLFFGTEPIRFTLKGEEYQPLQAQSAAMSRLATAIAVHENARLSGTFTDVVKGVVVVFEPGKRPVGGTDTGFPHLYPAGNTDRGVRHDALPAAAQKLVREAIESYTRLPGEAITRELVAAYLSPAALAETFIGYAGATDLGKEGSYVRIDGPRIWMELVVQRAIALPTELHYHALWRDKLADYGGEVGP